MQLDHLQDVLRPLVERQNGVVQWLLEHNRHQSGLYQQPEVRERRRNYRHLHRTKIGCLKCMDGRLNLPVITKIPMGIVQPFRNLGGHFEFGWAYLQAVFLEWVNYAANRDDDCLVFTTYHFSQSNKHLGCKGFGYDREAAKKAAEHLRNRINHTCAGAKKNRIMAVMLGIETDEDALIIHGETGKVWYLNEENSSLTEERAIEKLAELFPSMPLHIRKDFAPLVIGNLERIKEVRQAPRSLVDADHREQVLGLGRGFDWLHQPNKALLIGPFSYDVADPIAKAAGILLDNLNSGRIDPDQGVVLMTAGAYRENTLGIEEVMAQEKALDLARFAISVILRDDKLKEGLLPHLSILSGAMDMETRLFTECTQRLLQD